MPKSTGVSPGAHLQPLLLARRWRDVIVLPHAAYRFRLSVHIAAGTTLSPCSRRDASFEIFAIGARVTGESGAARLAVRRLPVCAGAGYFAGRGHPHRARPVAGDGTSYERAGRRPGDGHRRICHVTGRPHDGGRKVLHLRAVCRWIC